ncbi:MAG: hypothetical protein HKO56_08115 [Bacteroidia bacterium]|nr:acyloxyacyl hydrolase [Bacteroidia bacterium]NNM16607.1 hypothetical protein [Bacteroidia bacterium]
MFRRLLIIILLVHCANSVPAQDAWQWQDPADLGTIDLGNKYLTLTNVTGLVLSEILSKNDTALEYSNRYHFILYGEYHREYIKRSAISDVYLLKGRYGYQFKRWVSVGAELQIYYFKNTEVETTGLGFATYYNWYLFNKDSWKFYFDNGAGALYSLKSFPESGTKFNFNTFYGFSAQIKVNRNKYLKLGVRNIHISNAFLFGDDKNPAFDSIGFLAGIRF